MLWQLCWGAYAGGQDFVNPANIFSHKKEDKEVYKRRMDRAYYYNYVKPLVQLVTSYISRQPITREKTDDEFLKNVDRKNADVDSFIQQLAISGITKGMSYLVVDRQTPDELPASRADERALGNAPYWDIYQREQVLNWELDQFGQPLWVLVQIEDPTEYADPIAYVNRNTNMGYYLLWERERWRIFSVKQQSNGFRELRVVDEQANPLGLIPIVPFYGDHVGDWYGESWITDIAYIARNILNVCSLRDNYNYETAIEIPVIPFISDPEEMKQGLLKGDHYVWGAPAGSGWQPYYMGPSGIAAEILQKQIADHRDEIHRILKQRIINNSASADGASGVSKQEDFMSTNTTLADLAAEMERVENEGHALREIWDNPKLTLDKARDVANKSTYPDDFDVEAIEKALKRMQDLQRIGAPDELIEHLMQGVATKLVGVTDEETQERIRQAIEDKFLNQPEPELGAIAPQLGAVPNQGNGNGAQQMPMKPQQMPMRQPVFPGKK